MLKIYELEPVALPNEPSDRQIEDALEKEAEMIEKKLAKNALTVAMCIEGKQLSSEELAAKLSDTAGGGGGGGGGAGKVCGELHNRKLLRACAKDKGDG